MAKAHNFPYQYGFVEGRKIPYPIVNVTLDTVRGRRQYAFIMDSGADQCTMPQYMMLLMDVDKTKLTESQSRGIGKDLTKTREGPITIEFCGKKISLRCSFTDNNKTPLLLGKSGIFELFNISFDNDKGATIFEERITTRGTSKR